MLTPIRDFIVVEKDAEKESQTPSGLILTKLVDEKIVTGTVMSVGTGLVAGGGLVLPLEVKVNDRVVFNKTLAVEVKDDNKTFFLLREEHVLCLVS